MKIPKSVLRLKYFIAAALCFGRKQPILSTVSTQLHTSEPSTVDKTPPEIVDANTIHPLEATQSSPMRQSPPSHKDATQLIGEVDSGDGNNSPIADVDLQFRLALLLPNEDVDKPYRLKHCADVFLRRFQNGQRKEDIDQAVSAYSAALVSLPQESEAFFQCQHDTAEALLQRFKMTSTISDIDDAISHLENMASCTADDHSAKSNRLNALGIAQVRRFQRTTNLVDLNNAVTNQTRAVDLTAEDHEDMVSLLNNLGITLCERFCILGGMADIASAISHQEKALSMSLKNNHDTTASCHTNLGTSFYHRFGHSGDPSDISNAIVHGQRSVYLTPEGDSRLLGRLNNLAIAYMDRYNITEDMTDLSNAITCQQRVVDLTFERGMEKSFFLNNLGTMYKRKFQAAQDLKDIAFAISSQKQTIELAPEGHLHLPTMFANLSHSYQARFRVSGDLDDISNAVLNAEKAVNLTPANHSDLVGHLNGLGNAYSRLFECTENVDDLSKCIACHERAVQLTPEGHAQRSQWLQNLGKAYLRRHKLTNDDADMQLALSQYRSSATAISGAPSVRLASAETWAKFSRVTDNEQTSEAYSVAVDLISRVAGLDQTVKKRHTNLIGISSVTTEAAAIAFSKGEHRTALEWLEQGRCLVWNQLNQLRTPLDELFANDEQLASRLLAIAKTLEKLGSRTEESPSSIGLAGNTLESNITLEEQTREHIKLAQEWDSLLAKIHGVSGFKDFLRPRKAQDLLTNLPKIGYVVLINVHERRCDALILHSGGEPLHVPLRDFSYKQAEALREQLNSSLKQNGVRQRGTFRLKSDSDDTSSIQNVLSELWKCVSLRIMAHIHTIKPLTGRTRIWWCSTGPLAFLPLHAAGIYAVGAKRINSVPYFAVSSYIPTVSYLVDSINQERLPSNKFLLISQPDTPNFTPIPGTQQEVQTLIESLKGADQLSHIHLDRSNATVDTVKREMVQYPWIHVACHAIQDTTSPLQSGFHLHDGCLELGEIIKLQIPNADFAFLSACQTSTGDEKLSEEAVHLAAGMLAAGYRSIVSTMWSISDSQGPEITKEFYKYLFDSKKKLGHRGLSGAGAAYALDYATRRIREEVKDTESGLISWVPYVHFGV